MQEEENVNPEQIAAVQSNATAEPTAEPISPEAPAQDSPAQEAADGEEKASRTLKLNLSAESAAETANTDQAAASESAANSETAPAQEDGENQGGGRNRMNRNRRNRREPHVPSENPMSLT